MSAADASERPAPGPKVGAVDPPRADERVLKRSATDMQTGWLARHGTLFLTDTRLVFVPTPLDAALRAKRREMPLSAITEIERSPEAPGEIPRDGKRPRVRFHMDGVVWDFLVGDIDAWIDLLEVVYARRERRGEGRGPSVRRRGHVNVLLEEA